MSAKPKKRKKSKWNEFVARQRQLSDRNQKLVKEMNETNDMMSEANSILVVFSKWRMITYLTLIFVPPYGLYRVWSKDSTFRESEKLAWTFIVAACICYFVKTIFFT